jgi:flagellar FliL protein
VSDATTEEKPKKGGSKVVLIGVLAAVIGAAAAGGGWYFLGRKPATAEEHVAKPEPAKAPTYMAMETMVVNLADPGGERFAQLGITVELSDEKAADKIKSFLPSIRSAILLLVSQRTSEELLTRPGKEKLARDIAGEVSRPLGFIPPEPVKEAPREAAKEGATDEVPMKKAVAREAAKDEANPVRGVLFSSFIIQ